MNPTTVAAAPSTFIHIVPWSESPIERISLREWGIKEAITVPVAFFVVTFNCAGGVDPADADATPWVFFRGSFMAASRLGWITEFTVG